MSLIPCLVQSLGETLPLLLKKLDKLQNQSTHAANISENISHIRQLIQQARNAASKVGLAHAPSHSQAASDSSSLLWLLLLRSVFR